MNRVHYIASERGMVLVNWEGCGMKGSCPIFRYCSCICLARLRKPT